MSFRDRIQQTIGEGLQSSRELFDKARDKAQDLGEMGVLKLEIRQLDNQAEKLFARLGSKVFDLLVDQNAGTVSRATPEVDKLIDELSDIRRRADEKGGTAKKIRLTSMIGVVIRIFSDRLLTFFFLIDISGASTFEHL